MTRTARTGKRAIWRRRAAALSTGLLLLAVVPLVSAPGYAAVGEAPSSAQPDTRLYDIPPQSLDGALAAFSRISGLQVMNAGAVTQRLVSPGVSGRLTASEALSRLLSGTGLKPAMSGANTVTVVTLADAAAKAQAGSVNLGTIDVQGPPGQGEAQETAYGPGQGFVSHRSAAGTKTDTPLIETPQAISVVTADQIDQQGAQNIDQALSYTSGLASTGRSAFAGFDIIYSRGFILDRFLDGTKLLGGMGYTAPQIEPYGLERLDVLHGPASVLYGAGSPGGLVDAITKRPLDTPYHEVELTTGNFGRIQGAFDLSGPVTQDGSVLYRLTGLARDVGSQVDFTKQQRIYLAPAVTWRPDASTTLTILANIQHDPYVGLYSFVPAEGTIFPNPFGTIPRSTFLGDPAYDVYRRDQESIGYLFEHRFDDTWTVRQNVRFMHTDGLAEQLLPLGSSLSGGGAILDRYALSDAENINAFTVDNEAEARFATGSLAHTVLVGLDYQHLSDSENLGEALAPSINIFAPVYGLSIPPPPSVSDTMQITDQVGLYAQDQIKFNRFILTLSGRQDYVNEDTIDYLAITNTNQEDHAFTWRAGLNYVFDNGVAPYASYATSFQPTPGVDASSTPFKPTTGQQYEAGVKFQPVGWNNLFTLAVYDLTQQNVLTPDPNNTAFDVQIGEINSRGVELEDKLSLTEGLDVLASFTSADVKVTKTTTSADLGKRPVNIPDNTAALWAYYTVHNGWFRGLGFGGGVRYVGDTAGDDANTFFVPSFIVVDAALQYDVGQQWRAVQGLKLYANVTNLFDHRYVSECSNALNCVYGNGRTILGGLKYQW